MGVVGKKLRLLESITRLRRVQGRVSPDRDLSAVRNELERELGETVSRRIAARFLGVSHTALTRWTEAGDLPLVQSIDGRDQIPVPALLELQLRMAERRDVGHPRGHLLESVLIEGRQRASEMRVGAFVGDDDGGEGHTAADRRGLAYHRAIADRLTREEADEALYRIWKWGDEGKLDRHYADEWEVILRLPLPAIRRAITEDSDRGRNLRQNSPLAGLLSEPERQRLFERFIR